MRGWIIIPVLALGALVLGIVAAAPGERVSGEEGLEALDTFAKFVQLEPGERVLGLVAFYGEPLPPQWLILTGDPGSGKPLRESVFARGRVLAERKFSPLPGQDLPHLAIERKSLKIDSAEAFRLAEARARARRTAFDTVHYQLRVRDEGREPVWMLSLINRAQVSVGVIYLSAENGEVLRETWTHPGAGPLPTDSKISSR